MLTKVRLLESNSLIRLGRFFLLFGGRESYQHPLSTLHCKYYTRKLLGSIDCLNVICQSAGLLFQEIDKYQMYLYVIQDLSKIQALFLCVCLYMLFVMWIMGKLGKFCIISQSLVMCKDCCCKQYHIKKNSMGLQYGIWGEG